MANEDIIESTEDTGSETRIYELGFHLDGELPQEEVKKTYQAIRDHVSGNGTIIAEGEPTKVPLAYTISRQETTGRRDFDTAFFCWIAYEADGAGHEAVLGNAKSQPSIIRFLDIKTDAEAAKHAAEMHELFAKAALEGPQDEEAEADAPREEPKAEEPEAASV